MAYRIGTGDAGAYLTTGLTLARVGTGSTLYRYMRVRKHTGVSPCSCALGEGASGTDGVTSDSVVYCYVL